MAAALAAFAALRVGYTYPLAAYLIFFPGGIQYLRCPIDSTAEAAAEAEAAAALASSDLDNNSRYHSDKRGEGEVKGSRFSFFSFSLASAEMRRFFIVKDSLVGIFMELDIFRAIP